MQFLRHRAESNGSHHYVQLAEMSSVPSTTTLSDVDNLVRQFGRSLLNVSPSDIDKLKAAVNTEDSETIAELLRTQGMENRVNQDEAESTIVELSQESFFRIAVKEFKTEWIEFFMKMIIERSILFNTAAQMMQENFNELWIDYRSLVEPILRKDMLLWDICTIQVPVETFTIESNIESRVGTCNSIEEWIHYSHGAAFEHWRGLNEKGVNKVLKTGRGRKVNAKVKVCCFADICKTGVHGLIQFLLMHKAPTSIFKTLLIKWVIVYKWERIWKVRVFKSLLFYLLFFVVLHLYSVAFALEYFLYPASPRYQFFFAVFTAILGLYSLLTLLCEYNQLKRYIQAGRNFCPYDRLRGVRHYFSSRQNQIDLLLSAVTLYYFIDNCLYLIRVIKYGYHVRLGNKLLAVIVLFAWWQALCFAKAFKKTGIFTLMIGRVLQECLIYFILLAGIMVGFGLTMYMIALDFFNNNNCESPYANDTVPEDDCEKAEENFGDASKSILTMVYSMLGMFDPQVLFRFHNVSKIMIALFVLYLFVQTIVMFNLLIAAMGDAFDGVRATEEESFLMARAKLIDQYEASLCNKEIETIEGKIGKYLYVLIPEDKQLEKSVPFWKGRMTHIKEDVRKMVLDFQELITHDMNSLNQKTERLTQDMNRLTQNINGLTQNMSQLTQNTNEMFRILRNDIRNLERRFQTQET